MKIIRYEKDYYKSVMSVHELESPSPNDLGRKADGSFFIIYKNKELENNIPILAPFTEGKLRNIIWFQL